MKRFLALSLGCLVAVGCGAGGESAAGSSTVQVTAPPHYSQAATRRCLARTSPVGPVRPVDSRLRAFRDLAQRNSFEARTKHGVVALAFHRGPQEAKLFAELLRVPKDPYRIIIRGNVVIMVKRGAQLALTTALGCLRP